ncbi:two-component system, response regulator YesN [Thermanaeromonas toyohensis ToBE]|uniref:Two-component system, response regulator YesN n=2 Tax=Thermanaeromonas TaxID=202949 RepID=A0A1W1W0E4_9FIRM|nr:two-component system, response regulator YesN [Thermanaeromonas toyohensis ToBE]
MQGQLVQRLLRSFTEATGVRAAVFNAEGEPWLEVEDYHYHSPFCQMVNSVSEGNERCRETHIKACRQAYGLCDPYIFFCHAGLVHWAVPILVGDQVKAVIICGQVLMWELDDLAIEEILRKVKDLELPEEELKEAILRIQVVSPRKVQGAVELLKLVARHIATSALPIPSLASNNNIPPADPSRGCRFPAVKSEQITGGSLWSWLVEAQPWRQGDSYQLEKEQALITKVRLGDREGAETVLEELLGNILFVGINRAETIKFRLLELLALLSRAALAGGATAEEILELSMKYMEGLSKLSLEESILWIFQALEDFINSTCARSGKTRISSPYIKQAIAYINKNFSRNIGVEDVARAVGISPAHLSRLFKQELGRTVIEYLTLVRLEQAKLLLRKGDLTLEEISRRVGYNDVAYFSRVFKREVGVTPGIFRSTTVM